MRARLVSSIMVVFAVLSLQGVFYEQTFALSAQLSSPYLGLSDFLDELEIDFDEYLAIMTAFEDDGVYPHFLEKNSDRYEAFQSNNPDILIGTAIAYVNVNADLGAYEGVLEVPEPELGGITMLVNKNHALPVDWSASDLVDVGAGFLVREEAAERLVEMRDTMREAGFRFFLMSTYRTGTTSARLHNDAVGIWGLTYADLNWARGGHSEHQTGLGADILQRSDVLSLNDAMFENTEEYKWLCENAHNYGFIHRYPLEYEEITGFLFEPWHWRYVGVDIATAMFEKGITVYEEFYGRYLVSDVLHNVRELILEQRAIAEAEEIARLEREAAEKQAAEDAERAAHEAEREREEARLAAENDAFQQAEAERIAAQLGLEEAERAVRQDEIVTIIVCTGLVAAIIGSAVGFRIMYRRKWGI